MSILKSNDLSEMIYSILYKASSEPLNQGDLDKVKSLTLQETKISGKPTDVDLSELRLFQNLEHLIINGFEINTQVIEAINNLKNLRTIQFTKSRFESDKEFEKVLEFAIFDRCQNPGKTVGNGKRIKIIGQQKTPVDLEKFGDLSETEELDLNDVKVINSGRLKELTKLTTLDLSGSNIDNAQVVAQLPIKTKIEDEYLII